MLAAAEGELSAFRLSDGSLQWSQNLGGTIRGIGSAGDLLYIGTLGGALYPWLPPGRR